MPSQVTNYQCPSCMGPLRYDGASGKLQCDYCGSSFTTAEIEKIYQEKLEQAEQAAVDAAAAEAEQTGEHDGEEWDNSSTVWDAERDGMKIYNCPSCGAQMICDQTTAATSCPYCGNPSVVPGQFHGMLKPDYILPFKLSKEEAVESLRKYYRGKSLLPKKFSASNHLEEIKGVYVPFWLFDGKVSADISYKATRVLSARQGNEMVTTTEYYDVRRAGTVRFTRIPADGSRKMPDDLMDSIEPFDYSELKPFSTVYMPGFLADIYDVDDRESFERAQTRSANTTLSVFDSSVSGYSTLTPTRRDVKVQREKTAYALLPVWMLSTKWNGKNLIFAMNGQTGKFIGDLPVSMGRYFAYLAGIAVPLAAVLAILLKMM
ncbi:MAG: hypothetical protein IJV40_12460 [Oscillospiraceae bacterium]|nr:hypothetical protein [Oscillospiraceae bacterium]